MPITYVEITDEQLSEAIEVLRRTHSLMTEALKVMAENKMKTAYTQWNKKTDEALQAVMSIGSQALADVNEQAFVKQHGLANRFLKMKEKAAYQAALRERLAKEKGEVPKKRGRPPKSKGQ